MNFGGIETEQSYIFVKKRENLSPRFPIVSLVWSLCSAKQFVTIGVQQRHQRQTQRKTCDCLT